MKQIVVCGAGGFIGGHLTQYFREQSVGKEAFIQIRAVDIKPVGEWWQRSSDVENLCLDLREPDDCRRACEGADEVYQLAASMGGIGFIEHERVACMRNVLINAHMLEAAWRAGVQRYFYASSACCYPAGKQDAADLPPLKEQDAFPAMSERGYGWEKLYSEMLAQEYMAERGMNVRIARFHNIYGPYGSYEGGREKAPAAICRKVIEAKRRGNHEIEIWGDGHQVRSFCWIGDCVEGVVRLMASDFRQPLNIGSSESVTVNQLVDLVEEIAGIKLRRTYKLDAPKGVAGRNSDNTLIRQTLEWAPTTPLKEGLAITYAWIKDQYS